MKQHRRWLIVAALSLGAAAPLACMPPRPQGAWHDVRVVATTEPVVQMRCAKIPWTPAVHCWFVHSDGTGAWRRWEVWQDPDGPWGHVRKDLLPPATGVGGGPSWPLAEWQGDQARRLIEVLNAPEQYPHLHNYHYWPGPNSNTYVAWVLHRAGIDYPLPLQAVGKDF